MKIKIFIASVLMLLAGNAFADLCSQAERMAENYLDYTAFSRLGLIDQLAFEGFDTATARCGIDRIYSDWNEQAVKAAITYLGYSPFSPRGLYEQLLYEQFTPSQAEHGVRKALSPGFTR